MENRYKILLLTGLLCISSFLFGMQYSYDEALELLKNPTDPDNYELYKQEMMLAIPIVGKDFQKYRSPLLRAVTQGDEEFINFLLEHGADPNYNRPGQRSALEEIQLYKRAPIERLPLVNYDLEKLLRIEKTLKDYSRKPSGTIPSSEKYSSWKKAWKEEKEQPLRKPSEPKYSSWKEVWEQEQPSSSTTPAISYNEALDLIKNPTDPRNYELYKQEMMLAIPIVGKYFQNYRNPLHRAVAQGDEEFINFLLQYDADPNFTKGYEATPLQYVEALELYPDNLLRTKNYTKEKLSRVAKALRDQVTTQK